MPQNNVSSLLTVLLLAIASLSIARPLPEGQSLSPHSAIVHAVAVASTADNTALSNRLKKLNVEAHPICRNPRGNVTPDSKPVSSMEECAKMHNPGGSGSTKWHFVTGYIADTDARGECRNPRAAPSDRHRGPGTCWFVSVQPTYGGGGQGASLSPPRPSSNNPHFRAVIAAADAQRPPPHGDVPPSGVHPYAWKPPRMQ